MKTPVAFFIFNRPEVTAKSFAQIRAIKPETLLIVADGPRMNRPGEEALCFETKKIVESIDWPCTVLRNYSHQNLGCKKRISSGLDWVFQSVEEAIIVEDDCILDLSFFRYATELLERFRDTPQVMMIGATHKVKTPNPRNESYYFSKFAHIWGWATWRRAWQHYDVNMTHWPKDRDSNLLFKSLKSKSMTRYWTKVFNRNHRGEIDTWDDQWCYALIRNRGLCVLPTQNLVTNLGFGPDATHTQFENVLALLKHQALPFPLVHPPSISENNAADQAMQTQRENIFSRAYFKLRGWIFSRYKFSQ